MNPVPDLPERLRTQADVIENEGWLKIAWLMRHAADEIEEHRNINQHRFGSPPEPVVNPSEEWCDSYADWYYQGKS